jgi:hypothetical protein
MKRLILFCTAFVLCAAGGKTVADPILPPWEGDPMELEGEMIDDGSILCTGDGCRALLDSLSREYRMDLYLLLNRPSSLDEAPTYTLAVSSEQLCERLEESKPKGCSSSGPPSVPGLDPAWRPNGCGVGDWRDALLTRLAGITLPTFTGNLDVPFPGVSFQSACNAHDRCYGVQRPQFECDNLFHVGMQGACESNTANATRTLCMSTAAIYFGTVAQHGQSAYESAGRDRACAVWHQAMQANDCKQS